MMPVATREREPASLKINPVECLLLALLVVLVSNTSAFASGDLSINHGKMIQCQTSDVVPIQTDELKSSISLEFAKVALHLLIIGDDCVSDMIDWNALNMYGIDVGKLYRKGYSEVEKRDFKEAFIKSYSKAFLSKTGGIVPNFVDAKIIGRDGAQMLVKLTYVTGATVDVWVRNESHSIRITAIVIPVDETK